jgi:hypothetical protein
MKRCFSAGLRFLEQERAQAALGEIVSAARKSLNRPLKNTQNEYHRINDSKAD